MPGFWPHGDLMGHTWCWKSTFTHKCQESEGKEEKKNSSFPPLEEPFERPTECFYLQLTGWNWALFWPRLVPSSTDKIFHIPAGNVFSPNVGVSKETKSRKIVTRQLAVSVTAPLQTIWRPLPAFCLIYRAPPPCLPEKISCGLMPSLHPLQVHSLWVGSVPLGPEVPSSSV